MVILNMFFSLIQCVLVVFEASCLLAASVVFITVRKWTDYAFTMVAPKTNDPLMRRVPWCGGSLDWIGLYDSPYTLRVHVPLVFSLPSAESWHLSCRPPWFTVTQWYSVHMMQSLSTCCHLLRMSLRRCTLSKATS